MMMNKKKVLVEEGVKRRRCWHSVASSYIFESCLYSTSVSVIVNTYYL